MGRDSDNEELITVNREGKKEGKVGGGGGGRKRVIRIGTTEDGP